MDDKLFNYAYEQYLVGALLTDFGVQSDLKTMPDDLIYDERLREVFLTMKKMQLDKKSIDLVTVTSEMESSGTDAASLLRACRNVPSITNYREYIKMLRTLRDRRYAYFAGRAFCDALQEGADVQSSLTELRSKLKEEKKTVNMRQVCEETIDFIDKRCKGEDVGILTHIPHYDKYTGGLFSGELTIIGARPAVGKSSLGMEIALNVAKAGKKVLVCSREMSDIQYGIRALSREAGINGMRLKNGQIKDDEWLLIGDAINRLSAYNIEFEFKTKNVEELAGKVSGVDLLVVDYLQLMGTAKKTDARYQEVGAVSAGLKDIAMDFQIPVIAMAQAGRSQDKTRTSCPVMSDLRESGNIEQDADNIVFLHHPESENDRDILNPSIREQIEANDKMYMIIKFVKQRMGMIGMFDVNFDPAHMNFTCIDVR